MTSPQVALVTGAGAPTGMGLIRALKRRGLVIAAADISERAPGMVLADLALPCPMADDPSIEDWWTATMAAVGPDYVFSTITREVRAAQAAGAPIWSSPVASIDLCEDKYAFAEVMAAAGIAHPLTADSMPAFGGPYYVKPRYGEGSRDTFATSSTGFVAALMEEYPDMIVQQALGGVEWEVDVIADNGHLAGGVAFYVHRRRGGTTIVAETFPLREVAAVVQQVIDVCDLDGPLNIGGFIDGGEVTVLEVNPRFSHGFLIGQAAGADLLAYYLGRMGGQANTGTGPRPTLGQAKAGLWFSRYYCETTKWESPERG